MNFSQLKPYIVFNDSPHHRAFQGIIIDQQTAICADRQLTSLVGWNQLPQTITPMAVRLLCCIPLKHHDLGICIYEPAGPSTGFLDHFSLPGPLSIYSTPQPGEDYWTISGDYGQELVRKGVFNSTSKGNLYIGDAYGPLGSPCIVAGNRIAGIVSYTENFTAPFSYPSCLVTVIPINRLMDEVKGKRAASGASLIYTP
jgi:hypothetical protein